MKKRAMTPNRSLFRGTITVFLFTLLAAGMAACNGSNASDGSQTDNSQAAPATSNTTSDSAPADSGQKADRQQKRDAMRKQVEAVLTPEQKKQLQTKLQQGEKMRQALSELNLTADQKTKIREIRKAAYPQGQKPASEASPQ